MSRAELSIIFAALAAIAVVAAALAIGEGNRKEAWLRRCAMAGLDEAKCQLIYSIRRDEDALAFSSSFAIGFSGGMAGGRR